MSVADKQGCTAIHARWQLRPGRTGAALACAAVLLLAAGCATTRRTATAPSTGAVSELPQVPAELLRRAESGNAGAEFAMGLRESSIDRFAAANSWYRRAADQGYAPAEYYLGYAYFSGHGVATNDVTANFWYRRAADQGYPLAEYGLGYDDGLGLGTAANMAAANQWFRKAARQGFVQAQFALGVDYASGRGITRNFGKSFVWLRKAAERGIPPAEFYLGVEYAKGDGTTRNMSKATYWLDKASAAGYSPPQNYAACQQHARKLSTPKTHGDTTESAAIGHHPGYTPPSMKTGFPSPCGFYPEMDQLLRKQGAVLVRICIGKNGRLLHKPTITRSSGNPSLDAAALRYASATSGHWRPERHNGVAIDFCAQLPVRFALRRAAPAALHMPKRVVGTPPKRPGNF